MREEFLWTEKYRPKTIDQCVLPKTLKATFKQCIKDGQCQNLLLSGPPGIGKTTVAKAIIAELDADYIIINGSMNGNIDTLRNEIKSYASTVSFSNVGRKYVILDEADYLNANSTQPALRNFIEEYSKNCGFFLTCNFKNRIIPALHSRCTVIDFKINNAEKSAMASEFLHRITHILKAENVTVTNQEVLINLIIKHFPDWRRILNELQRYASSGTIDAGILALVQDDDTKDLVKFLKSKDFKAIRKWSAQNATIDVNTIFRKLYDQSYDIMEPASIPQLVLLIADYQYKAAFVADQEINLVAALTSIMVDCTFK